jgi:hypothetical protein
MNTTTTAKHYIASDPGDEMVFIYWDDHMDYTDEE